MDNKQPSSNRRSSLFLPDMQVFFDIRNLFSEDYVQKAAKEINVLNEKMLKLKESINILQEQVNILSNEERCREVIMTDNDPSPFSNYQKEAILRQYMYTCDKLKCIIEHLKDKYDYDEYKKQKLLKKMRIVNKTLYEKLK